MLVWQKTRYFSAESLWLCELCTRSEKNQRRKLDAKAHKAILVRYPPGVKGYKLHDEKKFVVSLDVQFFESIFPDMNEGSESVAEHT